MGGLAVLTVNTAHFSLGDIGSLKSTHFTLKGLFRKKMFFRSNGRKHVAPQPASPNYSYGKPFITEIIGSDAKVLKEPRPRVL